MAYQSKIICTTLHTYNNVKMEICWSVASKCCTVTAQQCIIPQQGQRKEKIVHCWMAHEQRKYDICVNSHLLKWILPVSNLFPNYFRSEQLMMFREVEMNRVDGRVCVTEELGFSLLLLLLLVCMTLLVHTQVYSCAIIYQKY